MKTRQARHHLPWRSSLRGSLPSSLGGKQGEGATSKPYWEPLLMLKRFLLCPSEQRAPASSSALLPRTLLRSYLSCPPHRAILGRTPIPRVKYPPLADPKAQTNTPALRLLYPGPAAVAPGGELGSPQADH